MNLLLCVYHISRKIQKENIVMPELGRCGGRGQVCLVNYIF